MHKDGSRRWMYPKLSKGSWLTRRVMVGWLLIMLFIGLPVLRIGGLPAVWLDVVHRRFVFFGFTFFATDTLILMSVGFLLLGAIVIFTALFGRVWCGWACPQTVYLEFVFRPIERLIEGKESARKKRDEAPLDFDAFWRKALKYTIFVGIALVLAHTFVAYFVGWDNLLLWMGRSPAKHPGFFILMGATSGLVLFDFAYFREQMCTIACPYARMQSVLMDQDSLLVSYDPHRGEDRARRTKAQRVQEEQGIKLAGLGDCIDCGACVRTCPTGIDIRDGLQMECIGCAQCVDACDAIMMGVGKDPGLVRYTSEHVLEGGRRRMFRPRFLLYMVFMGAMSILLAVGMWRSQGLDVDVLRSTGAPFVQMPTGEVSNRFKVRVQNRTSLQKLITTEIKEPKGARLRFVGKPTLELKPGQLGRVEVWIVVPRSAVQGGQGPGTLVVGSGDLKEEVSINLLGPSQ